MDTKQCYQQPEISWRSGELKSFRIGILSIDIIHFTYEQHPCNLILRRLMFSDDNNAHQGIKSKDIILFKNIFSVVMRLTDLK